MYIMFITILMGYLSIIIIVLDMTTQLGITIHFTQCSKNATKITFFTLTISLINIDATIFLHEKKGTYKLIHIIHKHHQSTISG